MSVERKVFKKQSAWLPYVNIRWDCCVCMMLHLLCVKAYPVLCRPERMQFEDSLIGKLRADDYSDPVMFIAQLFLLLACLHNDIICVYSYCLYYHTR